MFPLVVALAMALPTPSTTPLELNSTNPHYFNYKGKPTILISSGEHYGAVMNLDFPHQPYLDTLKKDGLNLTRLFSGVYCEDPKAFNIRENTMAPGPGKYIAPWARSSTPGYANGGTKFDLTKWDNAYFARLKSFCKEAEKRGIIVEVVLFCPFYEDSMWNLSPMNAQNNVNGIGTMPRGEVYTMKHSEMVSIHDLVTTKIVTELRDAPNIYYEICNEPYFGGVTLDWQQHISETITKAESSFPQKHLIAQNIANDWAKVTSPNPNVSIFNFHYASPPRAIYENYQLNRPIAFDETGFKGSDDFTYRAQAWEFLMAGGSVFSNLDYSFTTAKPDGTMPVAPPTPGGGSPAYRSQLGILKRFMDSLDFIHMAPDTLCVKSVQPAGVTVHTLSSPGKVYALYLRGDSASGVDIELPAGQYESEWLDTKTGETNGKQAFKHDGGTRSMAVPKYTQDLALRIRRK